MRPAGLLRSLALGLVLVALPMPAWAEVAARGDVCTIGTTLKASAKPKGAKTIKIKTGQKVTVGETTNGWVTITVGKRKAYLASKLLDKWCKTVARAATTPTTPAAATTPSTPTPAAATGGAAPAAAHPAFTDASKTKVAVMDFVATGELPADLVAALSQTAAETLDSLGAFDAAAAQDLVKMLNYAAIQQQLGCSEPRCLADVGNALGADYLVTGNLTRGPDTTVVQLQLTNNSEASVQNRVSRDFGGDPSGLHDEIRAATRILVRDLLALRSGKLAVTVSEEGATVRVDDTVVGVSPLEPFDVAGGAHLVAIEKEGFVVFKADVAIEQERTATLDARLLPSADFVREHRESAGLKRGFSWAGFGTAGLGLVGGGLLYYFGAGAADDSNRRIARYNTDTRRTTARKERLDAAERRVALLDAGTVIAAGAVVAGLTAGIIFRMVGDDPARYDATTELTVGRATPPSGLRLGLCATPTGLLLTADF